MKHNQITRTARVLGLALVLVSLQAGTTLAMPESLLFKEDANIIRFTRTLILKQIRAKGRADGSFSLKGRRVMVRGPSKRGFIINR